ncbi:hypothetical protein DFP72DRAFT_851425 [Ephemerocybe angulata]|uniref:GCM domain-containing protein n=1 Tax=Ephemerocybe angulata TaxID=980116 RepID=A0A8H6HP71_9AGAR|nr:hypothetical protein DFP72DRAFT_851425 [Tulosesus angulatus]
MKRLKRALFAFFSEDEQQQQAPPVPVVNQPQYQHHPMPYPPMYQPAAPPGHIYSPYAQPPPHMMLHGYHPSQYMSVSAPYMNGYGNPGAYNVGVPMPSFNPPEATQPPRMPTIETVQPAATRQRLPVPEQAKIAKPPAADSRKKVPQARDKPQAALEAKQKVSMESDSSSDSEGEPEEEGICTAEPGTALYDWPNGKRVRKFETEDEAKPNNDQAKWQFRSYGTSNWNRKATEYSVAIGKAKTSRCLGVDVCPNPACARPVKPKTDPSTQEKQIHAGCALCGSGPLVHHDCAARCHRYRAKDIKSGEEYFRWEHEGYHDHPRPPTSHLSVSETAQLDAQVVRGGANATVHALRTGDLNPGSVPLPDIAPALANPSIARYFVAKSQARTGVTNAAVKNTTAGTTIKQILGLNGELGEPFLIFSQLHDQGLFVFRTAFMNSVLEATVDDWVLDKDTVGSRHGFVTDGNHSYFKDGVLLSTSAFSETLKAWVPVLFTLIFGEDAAHHRPHFKHLNDAVMANFQSPARWASIQKGIPSQPQRNAHAEEYAVAVARTIPEFSNLSLEAQAAQMVNLREEAKSLEVGCEYHFWAQATRVQETAALVDQNRVSDFAYILRKMVSRKTSSDDFDLLVARFRREFPDAAGWLSWWIQPAILGMVFPAKSTIDPDVAKKVPSTSNAAEHGHSLLNHAVGSGNDLLEGIRKLYLHVKRFNSEFTSIKSGHFTPSGPREHRAPKKVKFFENDGHAPDTVGALKELQPATNMGLEALSRLPLYTQSFKWLSPNSCFWDHGIELFFRAYLLWSVDMRTRFLSLLPGDSFLMLLATHFDRRLKLITSNKKKDVNAQTLLVHALSELQKALRARIFEQWLPELSSSGHHSALCWIQPMIEDFEPCFEAQRYMAVHYSVESACGAGHRCMQYPERPKAVMHPHCEYAAALQKLLKMDASIGLEEYFSNLAVILPNQELHPSIAAGQTPCATDGCELNAAPSAVNFYWPLILTVGSNLSDGKRAHNRLRFDETFKIISPDSEIVYTLVGRIIHKKDHFTAELLLGGVSYTYDDMNSRLRRAKRAPIPYKNGRLTNPTTSTTAPASWECVSDSSSSGSDIEMGSTASKSSRSDGTVYDNDLSSEDEPLMHSIFESNFRWDDDINGPTEINNPGPSNKPDPSTSLSSALALWDKVAKAKAKPAASVTTDIAIPSCETCGLDGAAALSTILCHLCKVVWHTSCMRRFLPPDHLDDIDFLFCCPQCSRFTLRLALPKFAGADLGDLSAWSLPPGQRAPNHQTEQPKIISSADYLPGKYNDWPQKSPVMVSDTFTLSVQECYSMLWRDDFATDLPNSLGSIVWPIVLYDITSEEDVEALWKADSLGILSALKDAETAIVEFVTGIRYHPIMNVLMEWMDELPLSTPKRHFARKKHLLRFPSKMFSIPLFPGHRAAIDNYISMTFAELLAGKEEEHICVVVLLRLLVLRKYLKLEPSDDAEIFELSRILTEKEYSMTTENDIATRSRIQRLLTTHERAFYCNRANLLGNSTLDPTPQLISSTIASEDWSMNTHLLKGHSQIQRKIGDVPVEHPANLIRILTEDGSPYIMGTYVHDYKDDMALFGSTPYPLKTRPPRDPALGPEPFPFNPNEPPTTREGESTFRVIQPSKPVPSTPKPKPKKKEHEKLAHLPAPVPVATRLTRKVTMDQRLRTEKRRGEGESDEEFIADSKKRAKKHHVS